MEERKKLSYRQTTKSIILKVLFAIYMIGSYALLSLFLNDVKLGILPYLIMIGMMSILLIIIGILSYFVKRDLNSLKHRYIIRYTNEKLRNKWLRIVYYYDILTIVVTILLYNNNMVIILLIELAIAFIITALVLLNIDNYVMEDKWIDYDEVK